MKRILLFIFIITISINSSSIHAQHKSRARSSKTTRTTAKRSSPQTKNDTASVLTFTVNGVQFDMIRVEGGSFMMGDNDSYLEKPIHQESVKDFYIGKYEVTVELWMAVMGDKPFEVKDDMLCPIDYVSWDKCILFIEKLNKMTGRKFRLPKDTEWEFAARGGNKSKGYRYSGSNNQKEVAWCENPYGSIHQVGQKLPNELGLYDMSGNVWEWCQDTFYLFEGCTEKFIYKNIEEHRVMRGGAFYCYEGNCTVSARHFEMHNYGTYGMGLRLVL